MKRMLCLFFLAACPLWLLAADSSLLVLRRQVVRHILEDKVNETAVLAQANRLTAEGAWPDIDYTDKTRGEWPVHEHLDRLLDMAIVYQSAQGAHYHEAALGKQLVAGIRYWVQHDFINPNWWYPEIGVPKTLGQVLLLTEELLLPQDKTAALAILQRSKIGRTGQNKVWLSGNVLYRGLLTGDAAQVRAAAASIEEEIRVSDQEGIQGDYSYHQHGTQQQFGNYGLSYATDMVQWGIVFRNTPFGFREEKVAILRNYVLQGLRWVAWNGHMDISACGRQLFPGTPLSKARTVRYVLTQLPLLDPAYRASYDSLTNGLTGNRHFWMSDMTVHRRPAFYTSVKMSSRRVAGAESCNSENLLGYYLGDGATYFYQSGNEYTDIFPCWDWKRLPGTTTYHDTAALPVLPCSGYNINTYFAGGVSNGEDGIATLWYNRDGLQGLKSWFYFGDAVMCLGAGITSAVNRPVNTTVNQSRLNGKVWLKQQAVRTAGNRAAAYSKVAWVLHDGWGYYFPGRATVQCQADEQEGNWQRVVGRMPATPERAGLFTLWFNHGNRPAQAGYAYYVLPAATQENIGRRAALLRTGRNHRDCQVAEDATHAGVVFAQSGSAQTALAGQVTASDACVVLLTQQPGGLQVAVSDPLHHTPEIQLTFAGHHTSTAYPAQYDAATNTTQCRIPMPQGLQSGSSVLFLLEPVK